MSKRQCLFLSALTAICAAACVLSGCAGRPASHGSSDRESGVVLEYQMPEGATLSYVFTSDFSQTMEIQGQEIPVQSVQVIAFSVLPSGMDGSDYAIGVTIDDMSLTIETPDGDMAADVAGVVGGSFDMTLSKTGVEGNLPAPELLEVSAGPEGTTSIIPTFAAMFPDLPDRPVVAGDTWPSEVRVTQSEREGQSNLELSMVNTLDGFETIGGRECARITSTFTGLITGSGLEQGARWSMESDTEGTGVCYFDFVNGVFVSDSSTGTADGTITVSTPSGEMAIPVKRIYTMTAKMAG